MAVHDLYAALSGTYDADVATIERDLGPVLAEMLGEGLVRVSDADPFPSRDTVLARGGDVVATERDGETLLKKAVDNSHFSLDDIGGEVWRLLEAPISANDLYVALSRKYDADPETIRRDLAPLLAEMRDAGLVRVVA